MLFDLLGSINQLHLILIFVFTNIHIISCNFSYLSSILFINLVLNVSQLSKP